MRVQKEFSNYNLDFGMQNGVESGGDLFVRSDVGKGRYRFFNMSKDHNYLDHSPENCSEMLPANECFAAGSNPGSQLQALYSTISFQISC